MAAHLTHDWSILASVEGGEALIRLAEDSPWIEVSIPVLATENLPKTGLLFRDFWAASESRECAHSVFAYILGILQDKGIQIDESIAPKYNDGPSDGEVIVTFCLETSGKL